MKRLKCKAIRHFYVPKNVCFTAANVKAVETRGFNWEIRSLVGQDGGRQFVVRRQSAGYQLVTTATLVAVKLYTVSLRHLC